MADTEQVFWGLHCNREDGDKLILQKGYMAVGWPEAGDLRKLPPSREGFKEHIEKIYPEWSRGAKINSASQLYRYVHEIKRGDFVIYRSQWDRLIHIGKVVGDYEHRPDLGREYVNVRRVEWLGQYPLTRFSQGALYELGSALSLFQVTRYADEFRSALNIKAKAELPLTDETDETVAVVAEDVEQNTRDFILKRLAQYLKGHPLQAFVANLLSTMGYRTVVSTPGADEGIDIIAHKDELKLEAPIIKVQVKSGEGSVGRPDVQALFGSVGQGDSGMLVTLGTFTRQAQDFAKGKSNLRLIDGEELIRFVLGHYEQLDPQYKAILPLKRVYIPAPAAEQAERGGRGVLPRG